MDKELESATNTTPTFTIAGEYMAKCVKVYDGDTATFVFRPFGILFKFSCRMLGYNSAEIRGGSEEEHKRAVAAKEALESMILGKIVKLEVGNMDKYGRPLVNVFLDDQNINQWMIKNKYGVEYKGKGEKLWC